jgi:catechol 2,3-dioxygenase
MTTTLTARVRGVRSIEIEMADPERAADFYSRVWNLREVARDGGSIYFRGTGPHHHILAIHPATHGAALRRLVFDAADKTTVDRLFDQTRARATHCEEPHTLRSPGGGYGFGFADPHLRNLAVVCGAADHADSADVKDRPRKIAHVNLNTPDVKATAQFLIEALGFTLIDETAALWFMHCDSTDHSSMVIGPAKLPTLNHVAFEMPDLDSTMRGAGRMRDSGYPIEWGVGRHGAGDNVFAYFAGPEEFPLEYTGEVLQIDDSYTPNGPEYWKWPPGRLDQWGVTPPHTARWKRIQDMVLFADGQWRV